jgi:hypothetical protein
MPFPLALSHFDYFSLCFFFSLLSFCTVVLCPLVHDTESFKMASDSQPVREGWQIFFTLASKFFDKLLAFSIKGQGCRFPSDIRGFSSIGFVRIFFKCV